MCSFVISMIPLSRSDKLEFQPFDFQPDLLANYDGKLKADIIQLDAMTQESLQQL